MVNSKAGIGVVSLGCQKNLIDTESMLGLLQQAGYWVTPILEEARILLVNTCCFVQEATEEAVDTVLELGAHKRKHQQLVVTGCLAQRYGKQLLEEMPEIDALIGTFRWEEIAEVCDALLASDHRGEREVRIENGKPRVPMVSPPRVLSQSGPFAFLKIAEGCNHGCSFCVIPMLRGKYRSRERAVLRREAESLAEQGIRELVLVAQDSTGYGKDQEGRGDLADLLLELGEVERIRWIRVLYAHPSHLSDRLIELMASHPKICKYLDLPLQHCGGGILKRMGRQGNRRKLEELVQRLRADIPGLTLRTTLIVGFPGETEEEIEGLLEFVEAMRFERLGAFRYSREEGTRAALLPGQVPESTKKNRWRKLMKLQRGISLAYNRSLVGTDQWVLIDHPLDSGPYSLVGRTMGHAPEVDGQVYVRGVAEVGDLVKVEIVRASAYDLFGRVSERGRK